MGVVLVKIVVEIVLPKTTQQISTNSQQQKQGKKTTSRSLRQKENAAKDHGTLYHTDVNRPTWPNTNFVSKGTSTVTIPNASITAYISTP